MLAAAVYCIVCLLATTLGAISGVGGGVIIKPVMDAVSGLPVATIGFLSGCTVLSMSAVSLLRSRGGSETLEPRRGTLLAMGGAVGGVCGKSVFDLVKQAAGSDGLVGTVQSALMVLLTLGVLVYMLCRRHIVTRQVQQGAACVAIGFGLGLLSAFLGIGGGPINLMVLYFFFSMSTKTAALHSLYIILFSQIASLLATLLQQRVPPFAWSVMLAMVVGGVAGGFLGRTFSTRMSTKQVDGIFYALLIIITGISMYNFTHYAALL